MVRNTGPFQRPFQSLKHFGNTLTSSLHLQYLVLVQRLTNGSIIYAENVWIAPSSSDPWKLMVVGSCYVVRVPGTAPWVARFASLVSVWTYLTDDVRTHQHSSRLFYDSAEQYVQNGAPVRRNVTSIQYMYEYTNCRCIEYPEYSRVLYGVRITGSTCTPEHEPRSRVTGICVLW